MSRMNRELDRLLQLAATAEPEPAPEMPFGFETRVVALAREARAGLENGQLARFCRRLAYAAVLVLAFASSAAYWQMTENEASTEPFDNAYAIADTVIDASVYP